MPAQVIEGGMHQRQAQWSVPAEVRTDDGAIIDAALSEGCRVIAEQVVTRVLVGR